MADLDTGLLVCAALRSVMGIGCRIGRGGKKDGRGIRESAVYLLALHSLPLPCCDRYQVLLTLPKLDVDLESTNTQVIHYMCTSKQKQTKY